MRSTKTMLALAGVVVMAHAAMTNEARGTDPTYIPAAQVSDAFAKGLPLLETGGYKIHTSRRDGPGMAEVHVRDTDIIYVLEGTATLVTGGQIVDGQTTATDEIRGPSIRGGTPQRLTKGDVFVVPQGVPHWFRDVPGSFVYYVVKATSNPGGKS